MIIQLCVAGVIDHLSGMHPKVSTLDQIHDIIATIQQHPKVSPSNKT